MRAAVALSLALSLLAGCFPDNARHRTIAKLTEGGVAIGGVVLLATVNSGADCMTDIPGQPDQKCEDKARLLGGIGLGMILTGLIGFIVTVSTAPEDPPETKTVVVPKPVEPPTTPPPAEPTPPPAPAAPTEPTPPPTAPEPTPPGATPAQPAS